jgi:hypothetical protein
MQAPGAFVGLDADGALALVPPTDQSVVRLRGRLDLVDELRDEILALLQELQRTAD